ncbi:hypothetical protein MF406_11810 [Georgenia sp. TF02-10]|uniref:hypothetical protein n=1 Tax=Georgenia sp. TF02-10 TaxID=2917725 RepID=UPI001FA743AF|nr:hypothetical protein [Georgenia sp. TF02-10]UNX53672.1 hypothetical protein MF406_11810 [Georgenia sp. TF02-10]
MRVAASAVCVSWVPAASVAEWLRGGFDGGLAHYDRPPLPGLAGGPDALDDLRLDERFRFANVLSGWAEFDDDGTPRAWGLDPAAGVVAGPSTVRLPAVDASFGGYALPILREDAVVEHGSVYLTQTAGGRTGVPIARTTARGGRTWEAPIVWSTLALTLRPDGPPEVTMPSASAFPRHWVYGPGGDVVLRSTPADVGSATWLAEVFAQRTPWGRVDSADLADAVARAVAQQLADGVLGGAEPVVREVPAGEAVDGAGLCVVLDGVLAVEREGGATAQLGPGAVLGEAALLGAGTGSTPRALTRARVALAPAGSVQTEKLRALAEAAGSAETAGPGG